MVVNTPVVENSLPRRFISRLMRNEDGGKRFTTGGVTFMEALSTSMHKARLGLIECRNMEKEESSKSITENGLHKGGRIWLIWDPKAFDVEIIDVAVQSIHTKVLDKARRKEFWFTVVYGLNKQAERHPLWDSLRQYCKIVRGPWVVGGDFNAVMASNERIGGAHISHAEMAPLSQVYSRLDRVLVNVDWLDIFPDSFVHFLPEGLFDHYPGLVHLEGEVLRRGSPFKYFNMWSLAPDYDSIVRNGWSKESHGTPMFRVVQKLKGLKNGLRKLNKEHFGDIENLTHITEIALQQFQIQLIQDPLNEDLCKSEKDCAKDLADLKVARDQYLRQKAKYEWMQSGDDNTSYFHARITRRRAKNRVFQIRDMDQNMCDDPDAIQAAFEQYYKVLLGTSKKVTNINKKVVASGHCLTQAHCDILLAPVNGDEIKQAMYAIPGTKSPGPDGYTSQFFKDNWDIVGPDVIAAVKGVFQSGQLLKQCNTTILTLIPKTELPDSVLQFRPIACCNTIYKCLSKVLCARLGQVLPDVISSSQSAFIKGRDIVGNILICQDLIKLYKRKSCSLRIMMKLDLQKAYDSVEWSFVTDMMEAMDDLILFCKGDKASITLMLKAFDYFSKASGLSMNKSKSNFYCNGIDEIFWIEAVCRDFLWHGTDQSESPALVSWEQVCKPKKQGGMGLKDLHLWNVASIGKYAWWVTQKKDHLWVIWVHAVYIKQTDWMNYKPGVGSSWAWRKICQVKDMFKELYTDGNGLAHYSVSIGYKWLKPDGEKVPWYPWVLNRWIIPKHAFLCWLVAHQRLLTQDRLCRMKIITSNRCFLCGTQEENHNHLFFECYYSKQCLKCISDWCNIKLPDTKCIQWMINWRQPSACKKMVIDVVLACLMYQIWQMRNTSRVDGFIWRPTVLVDRVKHEVKIRLRHCDIKTRNANVLVWLDHLQKA
ncbi:uncharacterized protein LOC141617141 [Silene latifolia]|uniref:uncharacterized protein LOC141617141 n=1 Tax=Silene latifolia TaxID=37657 RepID=UPI003D787D80